MIKETKVYNGGKTVSSISSAEKTQQLHVKEWNYNIFLHHIQKETKNGLKT